MVDTQNQDGVFVDNSTPKPLYETVLQEEPPVEKQTVSQQPVDTSVPEVIPDDIAVSQSIPPPSAPLPTTPNEPPMYEENKNRFLFIAIIAIVFIVIFGGIITLLFKAFTGHSKPSSVTLTYWGLWEDKAIFDPLIQTYEKKNPGIKINYVKMDPQDYRAKILSRGREGTGPDIFRFHNTWLPTLTDVVAPVPKNIVTDADFQKTFYPIIQKDLKIGNYYYGLPLEIDGLVLIYNDDLLKRAGIQTVPKTWDELVNAVNKMTVKDSSGAIVTSGLAIGTAENVSHFSDIFGWMLLQDGGDIKNLTAAEGVGALELYRKFAQAPDNIWDDTMPNSISAFAQGKVAMIFAPSWEIPVIKAQNPDLSMKSTVLPILPGGNLLSIANYWVEGVSKYSKNQLEAWKFLAFLTQKDQMTQLYAQESKVRPFGEPYSRIDLAPTIQGDPYIGAIIQQAPYMKSLPLIGQTQDGGLNDEVIQYLKDAVNSSEKGVAYGEALSVAQKGIEQVFTKYKIQ